MTDNRIERRPTGIGQVPVDRCASGIDGDQDKAVFAHQRIDAASFNDARIDFDELAVAYP